MSKILVLVKTHLTIGKRSLFRKAIAWPLHLVLASSPLAAGVLTSRNRLPAVLLFAGWNYVAFSLVPAELRGCFTFRQIKPYPLSASMTWNYLWIVELLDYSALYIIVPSTACALMLYPNLDRMSCFLIGAVMSYILLSILILEIKLVSMKYPLIRGIVNGLQIVSFLALLGLVRQYAGFDAGTLAVLVRAWFAGFLLLALLSSALLYAFGIWYITRAAC
jgi:tetrahydromethanopterin S-methyltransferase subunit C